MARKPYIDRRSLVQGDSAVMRFIILASLSPREVADLSSYNMVFTLRYDGAEIVKSTDEATLAWIEEGGVKCGVAIPLITGETNWRQESRPKWDLKRVDEDGNERTPIQGIITPIGFF